ncbi:hypothetical protein [Actinoplanes sp. RD1]|uniref:hypothetical protein n=1 Tax=Actinoplanes sp. RD1 TaxID=3064538 RepID=UPI00274242F9|nr:hypothetical protein [Actinoplanes sp. RD1]
MARKLASFTIGYPHGIVVISDHDGSDPAPLWEDGDPSAIVSASPGTVMVKVRNAVVGPVTVDIWNGTDAPVIGQRCFDGHVRIAYGRLSVADAEDTSRIVVGAGPGPVPVQIFVEPWSFAGHVTVVLDTD